jgi:surface protein
MTDHPSQLPSSIKQDNLMLNRTLIFSLCIMAALLVASCTNSTSPDLEDSLDLFAGLEAITEAQQTNVTINKGTAATDGYFTIQIDNIDDTPLLAPGVHEAWCLEWNKNLRSNGDVHQWVKWFSTGDNDTWKPLNYLFSIRGELQASDPDLTFRDLQAVVWVLAGEMGIAPAFDVLNLQAERIPARLRNGSELAIDREKVANIAKRVMQEAPEATGVAAGTVAQTAADQQDTYTPPGSLIKSTVVDEAARTITIFIDAGDGNTITDIDLPGLEGFAGGTIMDGGLNLQTATLLLESDGSDTYSYAVTVVNSINQESSVVVADQLWPPLFALADNGVTIACPTAPIGSFGEVNGVTYEAVDNALLRTRRDEGADLTTLCTTMVTNMSNLFANMFGFNEDISSWDTGNVTVMNGMFLEAASFNQPIGEWDTGNVITFLNMFVGAGSFNQPIGNWDTGNAVGMQGMFARAASFNQPIGNWNTRNVTDMLNMFFRATTFNQNLSGWCVNQITSVPSNFDDGASDWTLPNSRPNWGAPCTP